MACKSPVASGLGGVKIGCGNVDGMVAGLNGPLLWRFEGVFFDADFVVVRWFFWF